MNKQFYTFKTLDQILSEKPESKTKIFRALDYSDELDEIYEKGESLGKTTYINKLDRIWRWRDGCQYCFTGYPGSGKSALVNYLAILQAMNEKRKIGMYPPEEYPVPSLISTLMRAYLEKNTAGNFPNQCTKEEENEARQFIQDHFYFIDFEDIPRHADVMNCFYDLHEDEGCTMFVIDPFNSTIEGSGDEMMSRHFKYALSSGNLFCRKTNAILVNVEHPKSPKQNNKGQIPRPSPFMLYGGSMWWNKMFGIASVEIEDDYVIFKTWKMKNQRLNGLPGEEMLYFHRSTNTYSEDKTIYEKISDNGKPPF